MIRLQGPSRIINYDETLTILREDPSAVRYVDGEPLRPPPTEYSFRCNVQPVSGRELLLVPEGDRFKEMYSVWSEGQFKVNDRVVREGANFQVQSVEYWGSYSRARIVRVDVGPNKTP